MESQFPKEQLHSNSEFAKLWASQSLVREWTSHREWQSYDVLPCLFRTLFTGKRFVPQKSNSPKLAETIRTSEAYLSGCPDDLLVDPRNVYILTSAFSDNLDEILKRNPKTPAEAIRDASFAYYVFERIHPFPDGNGRIGRMIIKRILRGAGLKDPVFHDQRWYGEAGRSSHLDALERVQATNNLTYLEQFLAESLLRAYDPKKEARTYVEIESTARRKSREKENSTGNILLSNIWKGFAGLPIYGNIPRLA